MYSLKVIIKDKFYEFQNERTEEIFAAQRDYLTSLIKEHSDSQDLETLMTALFSLYNLSEALIHKVVEENGADKVIGCLSAKAVN